MKTPSVNISSFNKAKKKDIQGTDTVWKMLIINKAPQWIWKAQNMRDSMQPEVRAAWDGPKSQFLQERQIANKTGAGSGQGDSKVDIWGSSCNTKVKL